LNLPEEKIKKIKKQNIFLIYYRKDLQKFFLEPVFDNKEVFFVFVKMLNPYLLTSETVAFCVLSYIFKIKVNNTNKKELLIEYGTNENLSQVEFNCEKKKEFYIGRKQDADININESQVSREQTMIYFENDNWYIKDGGKEKPSGSGTWLFLDKKYEIKSDMIFMVGTSSIKLEYILPGSQEKIEADEKNEKNDDKRDEKKISIKTENNDNIKVKDKEVKKK
jgi:biopolymer transport protein ExbD